MLDPVSAFQLVNTAAGVACTFVSNAYMIFQAVKAVKGAPKLARELADEISSVAGQLPRLQEVLTESLRNDLQEFKSMLDEMNDRMKILETQKREQLRWPFTYAETQEKLSKIGRYKETFNLALTVELA
jgi:phage shock protein A